MVVSLSDNDKERTRWHLGYSSDAPDDGDRALLEYRMDNLQSNSHITRITQLLNELDVLEKFLQFDTTGAGDYQTPLQSKRLVSGDIDRSDLVYSPEDPKEREKKYIRLGNFLAIKIGAPNYHNLDWAMNSLFRLGIRVPRIPDPSGGGSGGSGVSSWNSRVGAVLPQVGDYSASQVGALSIANNLLEIPNKATARTNLGVAIGSDVQAFSTLLQQIVTGFSGAADNQVLSKQGGNLSYINQTGGGGGGGEANTGANVGSSGVGVFKNKTGVTLNFKQLNSLSPRLTIVDDTGNDRINFNLVNLTPGTDIQPYSSLLAQLVSSFATASDNQVLTKSGSNLIYATPSAGGGGGETNTGANVGSSGVGIFKDKTGVTLNFKKLTVADTRLTITDDTANDRMVLSLGTLTTGDIPNLSSIYQPLDGDLTAIGAVSTNGTLKRTGANTWGVYTVSSFAETYLDDVDAATTRATLGAQAQSARLDEIVSGFTAASSGQFLQKSGSNLVYATPSGILPDLLPKGRLTHSGVDPTPTGVNSAITDLYYVPYCGNTLPIFDGTSWTLVEINKAPVPSNVLRLQLASLTASTNYEVYAYLNSGVPTLVAEAWTGNFRPRNVGFQDGILVGAGNNRTYLGCFRTSATGQTQKTLTDVFYSNAYNQLPWDVLVEDTTTSWTYTTANTWRQARADTTNKIQALVAYPGQKIKLEYSCHRNNTGGAVAIGIGLDSTTAPASKSFTGLVGGSTNAAINSSSVFESAVVAEGFHSFNMLEYVSAGTGNFFGSAVGISTLCRMLGSIEC